MGRDDDLRIRPGRIRSRGAQRARPFIAQALASAERAGGLRQASGGARPKGNFGRGRPASVIALRGLTSRSRGVVIKARVVRQGQRRAPLTAHLSYLRRDGVSKEGEPGRMFSAESDRADHDAFAERCEHDRHHFRFIVSPDDAVELADMKSFVRDLMAHAERDLGTVLDWVAVDHWNTAHPHIHVLVCGKTDQGEDLVMSRDYISQGMRARAQQLLTLELGPRSDLEIRRGLEDQIEAERWTKLDRVLACEAEEQDGVLDLRRAGGSSPYELQVIKIGRMRKLERLGLAHAVGPVRWMLNSNAEDTLRALGERGDIIKRMHRDLAGQGWEDSPSRFVLDSVSSETQIIGRFAGRGLDDELKGTAYVVIDGVDGQAHHLRLPDLDAAGDALPGAIVEVRRYEDKAGRQRVSLAVRSDLPLNQQIRAQGATWLDRQLVNREPLTLAEGSFGHEVREALSARTDHLIEEGLARRQNQRVIFARDLLDTLRRRELDTVGARLSAEAGLPYQAAGEGDHVSGVYRQRLTLASGRFAKIDDGLGFSLVPWTPSLEREIGRYVSGIARGDGGIDWSSGRARGLGI